MITAQQFYSAWLKIIKNNQEAIKQYWNSRTEYTNLVIKNEYSLIKQVAKELELCCYNTDYYSLDSVLYRNEDCLSEYPGTYLHNIEIAFEHENNFFGGLYQEVSHLLITKSRLNVLVSYPPQFNDNKTMAELDRLHNIILNNPYADEISNNKSFLLILAHNDMEGSIDSWRGCIFTKERWEELPRINTL